MLLSLDTKSLTWPVVIKVVSIDTADKTQTDVFPCVPCCGDSMWSMRNACCSTGDGGKSSPLGDGPMSRKAAASPRFVRVSSVFGRRQAEIVSSYKPGGASAGNSSSDSESPMSPSVRGVKNGHRYNSTMTVGTCRYEKRRKGGSRVGSYADFG
jgi:hypothetical protein